MEAEFQFSPGQVIGDRYRVLKQLGRGGMGEVWLAHDLKLRMDVALKTLLMTVAGGDQGLELLRGEVRAAREVISPNVCRLFDIIEIGSQELVSMEYIDGETLLDLLKERGPLEIQEAGEIGSQLLAGLEAIHQAGLVHRDVKPENIMRTRSGRVVIMDFGLTALSGQGAIAGTPAYMPPEQRRGEGTDARADVFSAGMVLAEMLSAQRGPEDSSRRTFWQNVRQQPPELPDTPWRRILVKAVAPEPENRYDSAEKLGRKLEEVAFRVEGAEDKTPYPGLESYSPEGAEFFFGREAEVEALWKKLQRSYLLAVVGASGSGKSSFINAGLLPSRPEGWSHLKLKPGPAPFAALGRALRSELEPDDDVVVDPTTIENPDRAFEAVRRWRARHPEVLLIVDQLEELFTQNDPAVQEAFADLLSRLALDADVHVLASIRDDFLLRCHAFTSLAPLFTELTPLQAPVGSALRRALTQPALKCGYRFEDEGMVDEMLTEVTKERGALPLIAFTAAQLWEKRDREEGLLTRAAYDEMGGVEGALAQHADATLEGIGRERTPIVRELFRNLVTAQGTRAVMEVEEVLSVFADDRETARGVLQGLIDARLLTSYEVGGEDDGRQRRVEIVHESLLSAWPRLVRWRTQDAEGAQLRDELRQSARLWEARNRSVDLLWTGTAFREFQLWREHYPGGLTALEQSFATAMTSHEARRGRRRRIALATVLSVLLVGLGVVAMLWRQADSARSTSEAGRLLALGRLQVESSPSGALAYALASLEVADNTEARRFALEVLWKGPTASAVDEVGGWGVDFSPDGRWLLAPRTGRGVEHGQGIDLWFQDGEGLRTLEISYDGVQGFQPWFRISPESDLLISGFGGHRSVFEFWSFPQGELLRTQEVEGLFSWDLLADGKSLWTISSIENTWVVQSWLLADGAPTLLGRLEMEPRSDGGPNFHRARGRRPRLDPTGNWVLTLGNEDGSVSLNRLDGTKPDLKLRHDEIIDGAWFSADGGYLATADVSGEIRVWSFLGRPTPVLMRILRGHPDQIGHVAFDAAGRRVASAGHDGTTRVWDLEGSPEADPVVLKLGTPLFAWVAFHPSGDWLATGGGSRVAIWPFDRTYPSVFHTSGMSQGVTFAPDESWVAASSMRSVRLWPLDASAGRNLVEDSRGLLSLDVDRRSRWMVAGRAGSETWLVPLEEGEPRFLEDGFPNQAWHVALSHDGRLAAAAGGQFNPAEGVIKIWNLETGEIQLLDPGEGKWIAYLHFTSDDRLVSGGGGGVRIWDLELETFETVREGAKGEDPFFSVNLSPDGRYLASVPVVALSGPLSSDPVIEVQDLRGGETWEVTSHGNLVNALAIDATSTMLVTVDRQQVVRAGEIRGEDPHLLLGHSSGRVMAVDLSPDGRVIASAGDDATLRLWPMPEGRPLHTLAHDDLLERLRALTNLRAVEDPEAEGGYRLEAAAFPGWEVLPTW